MADYTRLLKAIAETEDDLQDKGLRIGHGEMLWLIGECKTAIEALQAENARLSARLEKMREHLVAIERCFCSPNPTDPARIYMGKGKHRTFETALRAARAALEEGE